ncbi:plastocyanin/azurin family copper-binding protein [Nitrosopumilus sp. Nsub]|uniref:cupredoxin domain-containing protein n=1 Tax=Nitrosopumilus sp. Nsub TaxID=1776294 RepID=UPI00082FCA76|nr:plastocyanin/azurin family copper-binding protein [Nitrosopumilus sp. Nsub]
MVTKSSILGLIAALAVVLIAVSIVGEDVNNQIPKIETVSESGSSQACVDSGCYTPSVLTVKSGTVVTMTNTDSFGIHTFTSGTVDGFTPQPDGMFDSKVLMSGDFYERKFSQKGTYDYYCTLHTWMTGQIIVE